MATSAATFVLQDTITGKFARGRFTYEEALAQVASDPFSIVRRLDEVLAETGRA